MEFSEIFSFLIILKESIKILPKNGKLIASTAILSLVLPSVLLLSFIHFYQYQTDIFVNASYIGSDSGYNYSQSILKYLAPLLLFEIAFMLVFIVISHVSGIAIIIVSAASYQGNSLSSKDLFTSIKRTGRKPFSASFSFSRQTATRFLSVILFLVVFIGVMYPNILTISTAIIIGAGIIVFQLYSSVVWALSHVVIVVEESCSPGEAREKAGDLVKGHHHKGFMLNVFINLLCLIVFGLVWVLSYKVSINLTVYGLFFINSLSIMKMLLFMAYTVLYFQCKKHHGEEIVVYGNVEYTKLSTAMVGDEIP